MISRSIERIYHKEEIAIGETIVDVRGLSGRASRTCVAFGEAGQIVGLYGLIGAGPQQVPRSAFTVAKTGR